MGKELLFSVTKKDFRVDTFRAGGPGGQKQNKTNSGVRLTHLDSGAVGEFRNYRSQPENKKEAFNRLLQTPKWKVWHAMRVWEETNKISIEQQVDKMMEDIQIEQIENGDWVISG